MNNEVLETLYGVESIRAFFQSLGWGEKAVRWAMRGCLFVALVTFAVASHFLARLILRRMLPRITRRSGFGWDNVLVERRVFHWLPHLVPALILYVFTPFLFEGLPTWVAAVQRMSLVYMAAIVLLTAFALVDGMRAILGNLELCRGMPLRAFSQVLKIVVFFLFGILSLSVLAGKSPVILVGGLGAMAAVLMLVFKDAILGFVAGIQLSANDMVHVGDWIEMPKYGADGDVIDIALTTVKVRNWDKTITTIPSYALISDSFINWRGMEESGGRRIKRAIFIDMSSVRFCSPVMLERFRRIEFLREYLAAKEQEIESHNRSHAVDVSHLVNGRHLTNLGTFRAYVSEYLRRHPKVRNDMTFLVRHLAPTEKGLPIEVYVFSAEQAWANYEDLQADIFDHILAVVPEFDLRVYQLPAGDDVRALARPRSNGPSPVRETGPSLRS